MNVPGRNSLCAWNPCNLKLKLFARPSFLQHARRPSAKKAFLRSAKRKRNLLEKSSFLSSLAEPEGQDERLKQSKHGSASRPPQDLSSLQPKTTMPFAGTCHRTKYIVNPSAYYDSSKSRSTYSHPPRRHMLSSPEYHPFAPWRRTDLAQPQLESTESNDPAAVAKGNHEELGTASVSADKDQHSKETGAAALAEQENEKTQGPKSQAENVPVDPLSTSRPIDTVEASVSDEHAAETIAKPEKTKPGKNRHEEAEFQHHPIGQPSLQTPHRFTALVKGPGTGTSCPSSKDDNCPSLDVYTYHLGREGSELRTKDTGKLRFDLPVPTDTNHKSKDRDTVVPVVIEFYVSEGEKFMETIKYDLTDIHNGTTTTQLASAIAEEFILPLEVENELQESIERQIKDHLERNPYIPPVSAVEPNSGAMRGSEHGPISIAWHGDAIRLTEPGYEVPCTVSTDNLELKDRRSSSQAPANRTLLRAQKDASVEKTVSVPGSKATSGSARPQQVRQRAVGPNSEVKASDFVPEVSKARVFVEGGSREEVKSVVCTNVTESFVKTSLGTAVSPPRTVAEDGSTDYCIVCEKPGRLQCCDFCPRAYHRECLPSTGSADKSPWMCPACCQEQIGLPEDMVDGESVITRLQKTYGHVTDEKVLRLISMVYEMIERLIAYDFGRVFANPVTGVEGYETIVRKPMDLGSVLKRVSDGRYNGDGALCKVVVRALNDVELVWQNCFLFNHEGSAVFRMAEVQQRRADAIRMKSFDHFLSEEMKEEIKMYRASWESRNKEERIRMAESCPPALPLTTGVRASKLEES